MRVQHQPAYVLLNRPYSETSWIVEVFTRDYGRLSLMAKGARRLKSKLKGVLLPFQPLLVSWSGKGEVPTLTGAEIDGALFELKGEQLICGFYCNELLVHLVHRHDPHQSLYQAYHETMLLLDNADKHDDSIQSNRLLRQFERCLIKDIGYDIDFKFEAHLYQKPQSKLIEDDLLYQYVPGQGFVRLQGAYSVDHVNGISGSVIKSLNPDVPSDSQLAQGKQVMRDIMNQLLGHKKIHSRELFFPKNR